MRVVIQRVRRCEVRVGGETTGKIGCGMLVLVGVCSDDAQEDIDWLCGKIARLRIFDDADGVMNLDVTQSGGEVLVVSQFTLYASTRKGNRPSYIRSAPESISRPVYERFVATLENLLGHPVPTGRFGADMQIDMLADGPVTICIDSQNRE